MAGLALVDPARGRDGCFVAAGLVGSLVNEVPMTIWAPALVLVLKPIVVFYIAASDPRRPSAFVAAARVVLVIGTALPSSA